MMTIDHGPSTISRKTRNLHRIMTKEKRPEGDITFRTVSIELLWDTTRFCIPGW